MNRLLVLAAGFAPIDAGWRSTDREDYAFGIYDQEFGPMLSKPAKHRREILFDKVRDEVTIRDAGESADGKEHEYTLLFQLDTTNVVISADGRRVRAEYGAGKKYALEMEIVGSYAPNAWGLYDVHGNVLEWCLDWFADNITTLNGAVNTASGAYRVKRGGCWNYAAGPCRSAYRSYGPPASRDSTFGLRVVCTAGLQ